MFGSSSLLYVCNSVGGITKQVMIPMIVVMDRKKTAKYDNPSMDEDDFLERLKLFFGGNNHVSTLSVATLLLLFTIDGRLAGDAVATGAALTFFGLSLLVSLLGVFVGATMENFARIYDGTPGR